MDEALGAVYEAAQKIHFAGAHYRKDIGAHASVSGGTGNDVPGLQPTLQKAEGGAPSASLSYVSWRVISEELYGKDFAYFSRAEEAASDGGA